MVAMNRLKFPLTAQKRHWRLWLALACLGVSIGCLQQAMAAQAVNTLFDLPDQQNGKNDDMLVEANELVHDKDQDIVIARGAAQVYRQGHTVLADKITFNRKTKRVTANGNVKMIEPNGQIIYATEADITQNFREGFVKALKVDNPVDRTYFAADSAKREDGNVTVYDRGVYTACEPCKDQPEKPPLWQVKAAKIIHNKDERTVYYENARLELFGFPVGYFPFFNAPDPTVRRRSGFLHPVFGYKEALGGFLEMPYYLNLAPNYDATITPMVTSRQGLHMKGEWRHRLEDGQYVIRPSGIYQLEPDALRYPGNREWRGAVNTSGLFHLNEKWQYGWNGTIVSDRRYLRDYRLGPDTELISEAFLRGMGEHSYFDARIMRFQGLSAADIDRYFPIVHPVVDYNTVFSLPHSVPGQFSFDFNFTSLSRSGLDYTPTVTSSGLVNRINGIPGLSTRATADLGWKHQMIDPLGQVWTPFMRMRADVVRFDVNANATEAAILPAALQNEQDVILRAMPSLGMEYRYPFVSAADFGTQIIEPTAQIVYRPDERRIGSMPNEDSQSLIFDDSTLFDLNKFSGYDRMEGGSRANVGAQYSLLLNNGMNIGAMIGESFHLAGRNSYEVADIMQTGIASGLESQKSDYVTRFTFQPTENIQFASRMRFDQDNFALERGAFDVSGTFSALTAKMGYLTIAPRQELGTFEHDQALFAHLRYSLTDNWAVYGGTYHNLRDNKRISEYIGLAYSDECTTASIEYKGTRVRNVLDVPTHDVLLRINLRTLGETKVSQSLND